MENFRQQPALNFSVPIGSAATSNCQNLDVSSLLVSIKLFIAVCNTRLLSVKGSKFSKLCTGFSLQQPILKTDISRQSPMRKIQNKNLSNTQAKRGRVSAVS